MKKETLVTLGAAGSFLAIILPVIMLCYFVGQNAKQIEINTNRLVILDKVALKEDIAKLAVKEDLVGFKGDNEKDHNEMKKEINGLDAKVDGIMLRNASKDNSPISSLFNPYFSTPSNFDFDVYGIN
jgi:hypothetical protein